MALVYADVIEIVASGGVECHADFVYDVTVRLSSLGSLWGQVDPLDWINKPKKVQTGPNIDFNWTPVSTPYSYVVDDVVIIPALKPDGNYWPSSTYYNTHVNGNGSGLTFTATATIPNRTVIKYEWDFGDGSTGFGNNVVHAYAVPNQFMKVALKVTDDLAHEYFAVRQIYLIS